MPTPVDFMRQYRNLKVNVPMEDPVKRVSYTGALTVQLKKYFMMDWDAGSDERDDFDLVTKGPKNDQWFKDHKGRILTAAMGKGAPQDYELALEWAVRSGKITDVSLFKLQTYCDQHLGLDCSGFATNYLAACGKRAYSAHLVRNSGAASYFNAAMAVNDPASIRQGDLLVWMDGNSVKRNPGHIAVVESYVAQSVVGGNMRVVEATGASGANPKLLDSLYEVERIIPKGHQGGQRAPVMMLIVKRHGKSGSRLAVMRT